VLSRWPAWADAIARFRLCGWLLCMAGFDLEREKGIRWMPWHQEAMKDVARCEKPRGAASRR